MLLYNMNYETFDKKKKTLKTLWVMALFSSQKKIYLMFVFIRIKRTYQGKR